MELALVVYLISLFDAVGSGLVFSVVAFTVVAGFLCLIVASESSVDVETAWCRRGYNFFKSILFTLPILTIFVWLVPDKETSYTMLAAYGVQTVAESEQVQTVMGKSVEVFEQYMDQYLVEEKEEVKE